MAGRASRCWRNFRPASECRELVAEQIAPNKALQRTDRPCCPRVGRCPARPPLLSEASPPWKAEPSMSSAPLARRCDLWHGNVVRGLSLVLGVSLALPGCSSPTGPAVKASETENLTKILAAYDQATIKLGRPPANLEEFKPFLT